MKIEFSSTERSAMDQLRWLGSLPGTLATTLLVLLLLATPAARAEPFAYIANNGSNNVSVIDIATNVVTATIAVGNFPVGVSANPTGSRVYVTNQGGNSVSVLDTTTNTVAATVAVGNFPVSLAVNPAGTRVYVANSSANSVSVLGTSNNTVIATVPVGTSPEGVAVNPAGTRVYVTNYTSNTVSVLDTASNTVLVNVAVGTNPAGVAVNSAGTRVYVTNYASNTVSVLDAASNTVIATISVGRSPVGVAVNPAGTRAYVANQSSNTVSVLDTASNTAVATVPVGVFPVGVTVNPAGTRVYVTNYSSNTVSVIDTATNAVTATVAVGNSPSSFGLFIGGSSNAVAVEYYHAGWNFYFVTAAPDEIAILDGGAFGGVFQRTGDTFLVWAQSRPSASPTCRFFSTSFAPKSTHFYTPFAAECALVKTDPHWQFEAIAFYVQLADANGLCTGGTIPLYRLYNNFMGGAPNHRYTTSLTTLNMMVAAGWVFEGNAATKTFACVPQ
jgi:YVTN family beta-propeller protein